MASANGMPRMPVPGGSHWLLLLSCFIGYATLNRGFAYIGVYPFFIGEFALLFYLLSIRHLQLLPRFLSSPAGMTWAIFLSYNLVLFLISAQTNLEESLRHSIFWVYSIFFYIGYAYGTCLALRNQVERFQSFMLWCSKATVVYFALFPFKDSLRVLTGFLYNDTALVGYYSTLHAIALGLVLFFLFDRRVALREVWVAIGLILIIGISQARASMLAMFFITLYMVAFSSTAALKRSAVKTVAVIAFLALLFSLGEIGLSGERGEMSSDFFGKAIESIFFGSDVDTLDGSRRDRLLWWADVIGRTTNTLGTTFFGMGYDVILLDRASTENTIIRFPHNSFLSVFGFSGATGLLLYLALVSLVIHKIFRASRRSDAFALIRWYPIFSIGYFVSAFFSTVFEAPFHSYVFWVISGVVYGIVSSNGRPRTC
jgi:hypothetical protein